MRKENAMLYEENSQKSETTVQSQNNNILVVGDLKIDLSTIERRDIPESLRPQKSEEIIKVVPTRQAPPNGVKRVFWDSRGTDGITGQANTATSHSSERAKTKEALKIQSERELATVTPAPSPPYNSSTSGVPNSNDDAVCLVRLGNTFALPVTTHYGNQKSRGSIYTFTEKSKSTLPTDMGNA